MHIAGISSYLAVEALQASAVPYHSPPKKRVSAFKFPLPSSSTSEKPKVYGRQRVSTEISPHLLVLTEDDIPNGQTKFKTRPPIRDELNNQLLIQSFILGGFDALTSAHVSVNTKYKMGEFTRALPGPNSIG